MSETETIRTEGTLRAFAAYLLRPRLIAPSGLRTGAAWRTLAILVVAQVGVLLAVVMPLMMIWQKTFALDGPDAFTQIPPSWFLPLTVLIMPVGEELLFRGWLTGRKRALWLWLCAAVTLGSLLTITGKTVPPGAMIGMLCGLVAAPVGWFVLRRKAEPPRWFAAAFPAIFYLVVLAFALSHLSNYANYSLVGVPLALPQLWIGLMLGYIRMRIGLAGSIAAHILSNVSVLLLTPIFG